MFLFCYSYKTTMESTFLTLFIYLIIFIVKFNNEMFKLKRN